VFKKSKNRFINIQLIVNIRIQEKKECHTENNQGFRTTIVKNRTKTELYF